MKTGNCSKAVEAERKELRILSVRLRSFVSPYEPIMVTPILCEVCYTEYEEDLRVAEEKIVHGAKLVCIKCDEDADEPSPQKRTCQKQWGARGVEKRWGLGV